MKKPDIDFGDCTMCMGCIELCPEVFVYNDAGYIEINDLEEYPVRDIDDVIMLCPGDCITWVEE